MRYNISWGIPVYIFAALISILNLIFLYYLFYYMNPFVLVFFTPVIALDMILYSFYRSVVFMRIRKDYYDLLISRGGIEINNKMHPWESIKSISFQTGRLVQNYTFFEGLKLPAMQRIYLLDKEGKEYCAVIDIDYFFKGKRDKNNLIEAKKEIFELDRTGLLSDWAEKR